MRSFYSRAELLLLFVYFRWPIFNEDLFWYRSNAFNTCFFYTFSFHTLKEKLCFFFKVTGYVYVRAFSNSYKELSSID
jgi:hypothetical protein